MHPNATHFQENLLKHFPVPVETLFAIPASHKKKEKARRCFETELIPPQFFIQGKLFSKMTHFCQTFHSRQIGVVIEERARLGISEALQEASTCFYRVKNINGSEVA